MIATLAAHNVARSAVPTIAVGRVDPEAARIAIAVAGIKCTELGLIARDVHTAFFCTPGPRVSGLRARIARQPVIIEHGFSCSCGLRDRPADIVIALSIFLSTDWPRDE